MKHFIFLVDTGISWDIIGLYLVCSIFSLVILYYIIKAAVRNGIIEARSNRDILINGNGSKIERPANTEQSKLQRRYDKGEITFDEYKAEWNRLAS